MLSVQRQRQFVEKTVQLPNGKWALLVFELVERNGQIIAKAISGKILTAIGQTKTLCLPCLKSPENFIPIRSVFVESVYNFVRDFSFVMSQPTRAPSFC